MTARKQAKREWSTIYEITEMYWVKISASAFYFYILLLGVILLQHSAELVKCTHFLKMRNSRPQQQLSKSFLLTAKTKVDVAQEGLKIIRILYNISNDESLCQFRYRRLVEKIVKAHNFVKPEKISSNRRCS